MEDYSKYETEEGQLELAARLSKAGFDIPRPFISAFTKEIIKAEGVMGKYKYDTEEERLAILARYSGDLFDIPRPFISAFTKEIIKAEGVMGKYTFNTEEERLAIVARITAEAFAITRPFVSTLKDEDNSPVTSALIKAGRNVIAEALQLLDDLPDIEPGLIAVPWPVSPRPELDPTVWEESVIQDVKVADLVATQKLMNRDRVEFYVKNPGAIEENRRAYANVYAQDSELLIVDGHHRLAALWLLGAEVANVWFLKKK